MIELLSVGDRVPEGTYTVHSRFTGVANLRDRDRLISVVSPGIGAGPTNLVVRGLRPGLLGGLRVERGAIVLDNMRLSFDETRVYSSAIEFERGDLPAFINNLPVLRRLLVELSPAGSLAFLLDATRLTQFRRGFERALAGHTADCVRDIFGWNMIRGIERMKGCGFGLTPSGDDFISGLLVAMNVLERAAAIDLAAVRAQILASARSGSILTDALLSLAGDGRVFESVKDLVRVLARGGEDDVQRCTARLLSVGASSGADLATGFYMTLRFGLVPPSVRVGRTAASGFQAHAGGALWS